MTKVFDSKLSSSETVDVTSLIGASTSTTSTTTEERTLVAIAILHVIGALLATNLSPAASHADSQAHEHADAESNDTDPEPWVGQLFLLSLALSRCS